MDCTFSFETSSLFEISLREAFTTVFSSNDEASKGYSSILISSTLDSWINALSLTSVLINTCLVIVKSSTMFFFIGKLWSLLA